MKVHVERLTNLDLVNWIEDAQRSRETTEAINETYREIGYHERVRDEDAERTRAGLPTEAELRAEQAVRAELNLAAPVFPLGTKVKLVRRIRGFNTAAGSEPPLGTKGVITDKDRHGDPLWEQPDEGYTPVRFKATDLGYARDPDFKWVVYFVPNYAIGAL